MDIIRYALYGLPCSGKTTLLSNLTIPVIHGSAELNRLSSGRFSDLPDEQKAAIRIAYTKMLSERRDSFISDGHYSFIDEVVFTEHDASLYDVFIYLYCAPEVIYERIKQSPKNNQYSKLSVERIRKWQKYEIDCLRTECHQRNKDFYIVKDISAIELQVFIDRVEQGFSSFSLAKDIVDTIRSTYPAPCEIHICDGDKTIIKEDSFRLCSDGYKTHSFDGDFYTGYQALKFSEEVADLHFNLDVLKNIQINDTIFKKIASRNYFIISSGVSQLWNILSEQLSFKAVIANTYISADTKFFITKLLQDYGYTVFAYGDGKNDLFMLKQANQGYLYIGAYLSHSLRLDNLSGIHLLYDKSPYILTDHNSSKEITDSIMICKSDSGINGSQLAQAHIKLGHFLGLALNEFIPSVNTAVIVLERGGRFFGDGLYSSFGGVFYSLHPNIELIPEMHHDTVIVVDSVINTGRSILSVVQQLKLIDPAIEIFIATNVIQENALELLQGFKVFAVRVSSNSFVGHRLSMQIEGKGPDTADRLFNYIV